MLDSYPGFQRLRYATGALKLLALLRGDHLAQLRALGLELLQARVFRLGERGRGRELMREKEKKGRRVTRCLSWNSEVKH